MNHEEAVAILRGELAKYRVCPYLELRQLVDASLPKSVVTGASGAEYQVAIQVHWEGKSDGDIRVLGLIDDGGWRAFVPLAEDFITGPDDDISATW